MLKKEVDNLVPHFQSIIDQLRKIANDDEHISLGLKNKFNEQENNINQLKLEVQHKNIEITNIKERANNIIQNKQIIIQNNQIEINDLKTKLNKLSLENNELNIKIEKLKYENKQQYTVNVPIKQSNVIKTKINDNMINVFNQWASNPTKILPSGFNYVSGELKRSINQTIEKVSSETKWIVDADVKILFPNPNFMDDVTDISEFYLMDVTKLKPKGKNRFKIIEPCEIVEDGIIVFQGKLELL